MSMRIDNRFAYFKNINESLKRKYQTEEDFPYSEMAQAIDNIPSGGGTLISKTITENGTYNAADDNADGYDVVTVSVPEKNTLDEYFSDTLEVANIPSTTEIPTSFFELHRNLVNVIMPNVTNIGTFAFNKCTSLALTSLPNGVTNIGGYAFNRCTSLALTSLPNGVTNIGGYAFSGCTSIPFLDFSDFTSVPTVATSSFATTFPFYFRDQQQLDEWAAATNWSTYADRFQIKPSEVI